MRFTDQLGDTISLESIPKRIVSLVPSQTELLFDLGVGDCVVGKTKFCIHPWEKVGQTQNIGGTKKFNIEKIKSLNPELIIGNKEENYREGIDQLRSIAPVWMSDITTLEDNFFMIREIGKMTHQEESSNIICGKIEQEFNRLPVFQGQTVVYLIWNKPIMVAASGTFINHILERSGLSNVFSNSRRYPNVSIEEIKERKPDFVFLSSEPYPFTEKHISEWRINSTRPMLVDGELFSWYGSRVLRTPSYLKVLARKLT